MKTLTLAISGMHCGGCAETIRAWLRIEPGVRAATVSYQDGSARVLYDPDQTNEPKLIGAIERGGYRAEPMSP